MGETEWEREQRKRRWREEDSLYLQRQQAESGREQARAAEQLLYEQRAAQAYDDRQQKRQTKSDAWYSRECPSCAEMVKRKAQLCKECGFEFDDWEQHRKEIAEWEQRGAKVGVDPWDKKGIVAAEAKAEEKRKEAEYWASPEGQAEKQRRAEEKEHREAEEERRAEEDKRRAEAAKIVAEEAEKDREWRYHKSMIYFSAKMGVVVVILGVLMEISGNFKEYLGMIMVFFGLSLPLISLVSAPMNTPDSFK